MLQYWRVWILVVMVLASVFAVGLKTFPQGREGVEIIYLSRDSPAKGTLQQGMIITEVNAERIRSLDDWNKKTIALSGNVSVRANGELYQFPVNRSLGINVIGIERTNIDFGLDFKGGTRVILKPEGNVSEELLAQTIGVLETRSNLFGLREIKFLQVKDIGGEYFIQIEAAGVGNEIVDDLLSRQGKFEAKVVKPVDLLNNSGFIQLGSERFPLEVVGNGTIKINSSFVEPGQMFSVRGVEFEYQNRTGNRLILLAKIFQGSDIELVQTDPQRSGIIQRGDVFEFFFSVLISPEGAKRFADVTTGIPKFFDVNSGQEYLDSSLLLSIDGEIVSSLRIGADLGGQVVQSPQVTGSETTMESAIKEKLRLQTILRSGALPVTLTTASVDVISPTLGIGFFDSALKAGLMAAGVVFIIIFARYRRLKVAIPITLTTISEVVIIMGIAATNDALVWGIALVVNIIIVIAAWTKKHGTDSLAAGGAILIPLIGMMSWTIDLPAIAGIIAAIGTGVDHLVVISDETRRGGKEQVYGIREKMKMAFFIVFGAAATTIFSLLPLLFVGVGLLRGFAITSIVGVLIGVLITRPAYAKIAEKVSGG